MGPCFEVDLCSHRISNVSVAALMSLETVARNDSTLVTNPSSRYKAWWLCHIASSDPGRPDIPGCNVVHIVEQWYEADPPTTIHVFSNAASVELWLNDRQIGETQAMHFHGYAAFEMPRYEPGTLVAIGK